MRTCLSCQRTTSADELACAKCGSALVEIAMSDTVRSSQAEQGNPGNVRATPIGLSGPRALADRYEILRKVGEGGMGAVYEARHVKIGKRVAIKILLDKYIAKADVVARLLQEARLASSIGHENIVDITDFGETSDGRTFVVMEFLDGESLHDLLSREGCLPPVRALAILRQVASALGAAHQKGIVHRDVKPENIFITRRGDADFVKVVDFGISKAVKPDEDISGSSPRLTTTGMILGTPLYLSPEQARGEDDLDHLIDIYALGVVFYEVLTGDVPFHGANYLSIISQILEKQVLPPSMLRPDLALSPDLDAVVFKAMAKERDQRYATMAELDADLARLERGVTPVAPTSFAPTSSYWPKTLRWGLGVGMVAAAVVLAVPRIVGNDAPPPTPALAPPPAPIAPVPAPLPPPQPIRVEVTSNPSNAEVWWESVRQGVTPLTMELPRSDDQIEIVLRLDGYIDGRAKFYPTQDRAVAVTLNSKPKPVPKPPERRRTAQPSVDSGPTSGGEIKPNPFGNK